MNKNKLFLHIFLVIISFSFESFAKNNKVGNKINSYKNIASKNLNNEKKIKNQSYLVIDMENGKVIKAKDHNKKIYPASLTKMMTSYLVFEKLKNGTLRMNERVVFSKRAADMKPCKINIPEGSSITLREALESVIVKSANDSSVAIAEHIAKNEYEFSKMMNKKAKDLGMNNTFFKNASGWHDSEQKTTAVDLAKLAIAIHRNFPEFYKMFSKTDFVLNGKVVKGHNRVVEIYEGAEGMKTGYTDAAGYNLVTTAKRGNKRIVAIITGQKSSKIRTERMIAMLDEAFGRFNHASVVKPVYKNNYRYNNKNRNVEDKINSLITKVSKS